jgi:hypothetical protein
VCGAKDAAGCEDAVDIPVEDLSFIVLEELTKLGAYDEIERAIGIIPCQKRVASDELNLPGPSGATHSLADP